MSSRARRAGTGAAAAVALVVPIGLATLASPAEAAPGTAHKLEKAVTLDGTLRHLRALQAIADANAGNRAAGTTGHAASAGYVAGQLAAAGYDVSYDPFEFELFSQTAPAVLARTAPTPKTYGADDFATMSYSGSGDVTAPVQAVDVQLPPPAQPGSTSGCEAADFAGFTAGNIALVQRGTCTFQVKAQNAKAAGAAAVIIFNEGQEGRTEVLAGTVTADAGVPVVGTSFAVGQELVAAGTVVHVATSTKVETRSTYNVVAESRRGRADNVVMAGAHLDSVTDGPGINDNGSGSAALLETAIQFARTTPKPVNKVRFAWWSAEEEGLLGSEAYVAGRTTAQLGDIALYLNFDMVASPNYGLFVYDGDNSDGGATAPGPQGSAAIEQQLTRWFAGKRLPTETTPFNGRSDYGAFIDRGIPAGGLFTGAEGVKTDAQAAKWGGTAGVAYDACYHQACDTVRNLNLTALRVNADAVASAVGTFAQSTEAVNGRGRPGLRAAAEGKAAAPALEHRGHRTVR